MIWTLIGTIGGKVLYIFDDVAEDKDEANRLKFQFQHQLLESKGTELEAQATIVLAEAQSEDKRSFELWQNQRDANVNKIGKTIITWLKAFVLVKSRSAYGNKIVEPTLLPRSKSR